MSAMLMPPGPTTGGSIRFSYTERSAKMPRSSGQKPMPARPTMSGRARINSWSRNLTLPVRLGSSPMIAFSVVLLPAPLRPSSVTTSPSRTSKSMPCSTWLSSYQAFSPETSSMVGPQIGGDHVGVLRDRLVIAFGQDLAACQHGDAIRQAGHHREIMFDHKDRTARAQGFDQL